MGLCQSGCRSLTMCWRTACTALPLLLLFLFSVNGKMTQMTCQVNLYILFCFAHATRHAGSYFPDQGSNPCPLQWKHGVLTIGPPGKSQFVHSNWQKFLDLEFPTYKIRLLLSFLTHSLM